MTVVVSIGSAVPSVRIFALVLAVICIVSINNYFCYHEPSAIALQYERFYNLNTRQFGTLFTIYSAPNVVLVFFSGRFVDLMGLRRSSLLFNGFILIGMLIPTILPSKMDTIPPSQMYTLLLLSRFLLGLGGESICACVSTMISRWFSSTNYLNTAMALNQASVQLLGSAAAFYVLPQIHNIATAQWITVFVCSLSLLANTVYNYLDYKYQSYVIQVNDMKDDQLRTSYDLLDPPSSTWTEKDTPNPLYEAIPIQEDLNHYEMEMGASSDMNELSNPTINPFPVLKEFSFLFWLILIHIGLVSPILYTFTAFGPMYLQETFPSRIQSSIEAGTAISLLYMTIVTAPFTGMIIDLIGHRFHVQFLASSMIPLLFILLTCDFIDPKLCMGLMGVLFSITESNGLVLISMTVPSHLTGTAFGLYACFISIALLIEPAAVGWIREKTGSFALSIWMFIGLTFAGSIIALLIVYYAKNRFKMNQVRN